jgi:Fe-S-cluster containining protein
MGEIIEIQEELGSCSFRIGFTVTGEERRVSVDPSKLESFRSGDIKTLRPMACPFLVQLDAKKFACSVHASRPGLCRSYSCYRILVLDSQENRIGKVADSSRYFTTLDTDLKKLWYEKIAGVVLPDEKCWEEYVEQTLIHAGYRVVR